MAYQIDQSNKIEQTNKDTVLALSNSIHCSVKIISKTKRQAQEMFRMNGESRVFVFKTFAAGIYLLLKNSNIKQGKIIIDIEYPGRDKQIKLHVENMLSENEKNKIEIIFKPIGKSSPAHNLAYKVSTGKNSADKIISLKEIRNCFRFKTKSRGV